MLTPDLLILTAGSPAFALRVMVFPYTMSSLLGPLATALETTLLLVAFAVPSSTTFSIIPDGFEDPHFQLRVERKWMRQN